VAHSKDAVEEKAHPEDDSDEDDHDVLTFPDCQDVQFMSEASLLSGQAPPKRRRKTTTNLASCETTWKPPPALSDCPFSKDKPCCKKPTPCYQYFGSNVQKWRETMLYNTTLSQREVADRLREHRVQSAGTLPGCKKGYCIPFQQWWAGDVNLAKLFPDSHYAGNRKRTSRVHADKPADKRALSKKDVSVISWFTALKPVLECMPDKQEYHIAAPFKKTVHSWYQKDCKRYPTVYLAISEKYFQRCWRVFFADVKLRKVLRFTKCATCEELRRICWDHSTSATERLRVKGQLEDHYRFIKVERGGAIARANEAVMNPGGVLSIALDGTAQLPRGLPQFATTVHGDEKSLNRLHHHFTLAVVHGMGTRCYITRDNIASDPNLTVECLQRTLMWAEGQRGGSLPGRLYIQVDNCWRENKNSVVLNWLSSLVERGLFPDGIYLSFLPVGHTHNEVDQVASRISIAVRDRDIHTPEELVKCLREAFDDMDIEVVQHVADTKQFLNPKPKKKNQMNNREKN